MKLIFLKKCVLNFGKFVLKKESRIKKNIETKLFTAKIM